MATKTYHEISKEHGGMKVGTRVKLTKPHHEVGGDLKQDSLLTLHGIVHFPTRYLLKDEEGKLWTVPVHAVVSIAD